MSRTRISVLALAALGWWSPVCLAQAAEDPVSDLETIETFYGKPIEEKVGTSIKNNLHNDLAKLQFKENLTEQDKRIYAAAARYYVFRITWPEYAGDAKKMDDAIQDFRTQYARYILRARNPGYFHDQAAENFREVFKRDFMKNRLTSVNAALMLPGFSTKIKTEEFSKMLTDVIKDPKQHDAVKLYAIRALKDFFPVQPTTDPKALAHDLERIQTLTDYIERNRPVTKEKDKELQERAAIYFLRREAIHSLAQAQLPIVRHAKKGTKNDGHVAVTLLRVLAKNELQPPPAQPLDPLAIMGLSERCQAAFGLCDLKPDPTYQPDISVYAIGHCLSEFIDAYRADGDNIYRGTGVGFKKNGERIVPMLPWKTLAERWKESLKNLVKSTEGHPAANKQAQLIHKETEKILQQIATYATVEPGPARDFNRLMSDPAQRPAAKSLFKGTMIAEVNLGY